VLKKKFGSTCGEGVGTEKFNTYVSLTYELKKNRKVITSKSVGTGPSSYKERIYRAANLPGHSLTKVEKH